MLRLAHLVNPFTPGVTSDLHYAQPITLETMRLARDMAATHGVGVELLSAQFAEDRAIIPDYFTKTPDLDRSADDFQHFSKPKKLPLIADLLDRLYHGTDAPYLIYTNIDIGLQPHFYVEVARKIASGLDAFVINRRRLPGHFRSIEELPEIYAHRGAPHPGFDCFVFHRDLYPRFRLGHVCIGIPFIEITLSQNLFCYARKFELFDRDFLTFHIGMEIFKKRDPEYFAFNRNEFRQCVRMLWPDLDSRKFPWGNRSLLYRMIRWGLHPCIPIKLALQLEPRRWVSK
jgi:hypothetical protein